MPAKRTRRPISAWGNGKPLANSIEGNIHINRAVQWHCAKRAEAHFLSGSTGTHPIILV